MSTPDDDVWNLFLQRHGEAIAAAALEWCAGTPKHEFARASVREQLAGYDGVEPVEAFLARALANAHEQYVAAERARLEAATQSGLSEGWGTKLRGEKDWILGLIVGGSISVLCLLVIFPRQEYAKAVRSPADELIAREDRQLEPPLATRLENARKALGKGKVDSAMQDLKVILAVRGDNQEARWLLASTYDRLGDTAHAATQYKLFLDVFERQREITDDRAQRARKRLELFSELP